MKLHSLNPRIFKRLIVLVLLFALGACAPPAVKQPLIPPTGVYYLDPVRGQFPAFPVPPPLDSAADRADLKILAEWQANRTPADCARVRLDTEGNFAGLFGRVMPFSEPPPPEVAAFFKRVHSDLDYAVGAIKERYHRPRPFLRGVGLEPCLDRIGGYSYPSGHATNGRLFALILSDLSPEQRAVFMVRAEEAALNRVIGGVHYPSDIEAGKALGEEIYAEMLANPAFRQDEQFLKKYVVQPAARAEAAENTATYVSAKGERLTASFDIQADRVTLHLPDGSTVRLPRAMSASGARYAADRMVFWEHQGEASVWIGETLIFRGAPAPKLP